MGSTNEKILAILRRSGGSLTSPDGRGISLALAEEVGVTQGGIAQALRTLEDAGAIGRHINGKRTYAVFLTGHEPTTAAPTPTQRPRAVPTGKPPAGPVKTTRMSIADHVDTALARTNNDPVVKAAFERIEEELADCVDRIAVLLQLDLDAGLLGRYVSHVTFCKGPGLTQDDRDASPVSFQDHEWDRLLRMAGVLVG